MRGRALNVLDQVVERQCGAFTSFARSEYHDRLAREFRRRGLEQLREANLIADPMSRQQQTQQSA
jgi:hypothetical protein